MEGWRTHLLANLAWLSSRAWTEVADHFEEFFAFLGVFRYEGGEAFEDFGCVGPVVRKGNVRSMFGLDWADDVERRWG